MITAILKINTVYLFISHHVCTLKASFLSSCYVPCLFASRDSAPEICQDEEDKNACSSSSSSETEHQQSSLTKPDTTVINNAIVQRCSSFGDDDISVETKVSKIDGVSLNEAESFWCFDEEELPISFFDT